MNVPAMDPDESRIRERYGLAPARGPKMARRHRLVLAAMRTAGDLVPGGEFRMSIAYLMRATGLGQASVAFSRNDLLRWGLVERVTPGGGALAATWRVVAGAAPESSDEFLRRAGVRMP